MTSKEFILWLKGFTEGVHEYNITPKQWDYLKEKLAEVNDGTPIGEGGWGTPNTTPNTHPFPTWQHPHYIDPYNPYKITCGSGSFGTITTTPGTGYITTYNPSSVTYSTGSAWSYTSYSGGDMGTIGSKPKTQTDYQREHSKPLSKKRKAKSVKEWEDTYDLGGEE
jgi:hypothetical protein